MNLFTDKNIKSTKIETLGEFGLINHLTTNLSLKNNSSIFGVGDDAAVVDLGKKYSLVSKDLQNIKSLNFY